LTAISDKPAQNTRS